jgi:hypothetical protein
MNIDELFAEDPEQWVMQLPKYQSETISELLIAGNTYEQVAIVWLTASAQNTFGFSASQSDISRSTFLSSVKVEVRAFLCGNARYKKERDGLFHKKCITHSYLVSVMAAAIAPYSGMAASALAPIIALVLASIGKIAVNAWCRVDEKADGA